MGKTAWAVALILSPSARAFAQMHAAPAAVPGIAAAVSAAAAVRNGVALPSGISFGPNLSPLQPLPILPASPIPTVSSNFNRPNGAAPIATTPETIAPAAEMGSAEAPSSQAASGVAGAAGASAADSTGGPVSPSRPDLRMVDRLQDLARLFTETGVTPSGSHLFDGMESRGADLEDVVVSAPSAPVGVVSVVTHPLRTAADVELIPRLGNSAKMHEELRAKASSVLPIDLIIYGDPRGGVFQALHLSRDPNGLQRFPDFQPHEISTIQRIRLVTPDLQVIVREDGETPDLIVGGVPTEMKSVHAGDVEAQLTRANQQLAAFAQRHGLGSGAVALDIKGRALPVESVQAGIAAVVRKVPALGFERVYAFNGGAWQTYARVDGEFRLSPGAIPFFAPARAAAARSRRLQRRTPKVGKSSRPRRVRVARLSGAS